ncbi:flagellar hook-basal body complex protein FliE [Brevibacillus dissolubilis]|uniref:flagellar hook-basal body complex protein FliE n=1 Tax=Brevibacillus dissolubilis TaxID=1844116 RepID=UPI001117330C|nr:flagellar hook-basal body complex protein FliE [Brevibacillus dissolubilis]
MEISRLGKIAVPQPLATPTATPAQTAESFSKFLSEAVDNLNASQAESETLGKKFAAGQVEDVHQVMVASQKASLMLSMTMQVRNKVIESYQEIMRMQV